MGFVLRAGVILGVLVVAWTFLMGFAGWYKDPALVWLFWVVIALQVAVLLWALRRTAPANGYAGQVGVGTGLSLVAAVLVFLGSLLFTSVVFPDYFAQVRAMGEQVYASQGKSPEEIAQLLERDMATQTSFLQALFGAVGTVVTGLVVSAILAIFLRRKDAREQPAGQPA